MRHEHQNDEPDLITKLRHWLIEPFDDIPEAALPKTQALSSLMLVTLLLGIALMIAYFLSGERSSADVQLNLLGLFITGIIYLFTRTSYQGLAQGLVIAGLTIPAYILVIPNPGDPENSVYILSYLFIAIFVANVFLSYRTVAILIALNAAGIVAIPLLFGEIDLERTITGPFSIFLVASVMALMFRWAYNLIYIPPKTIETGESLPLDIYPFPIAVHVDEQIVYVNDEGASLFGAETPGELLGQPIARFLSSNREDTPSSSLQAVTAGSKIGLRSMQQIQPLNGAAARVVEMTSVPITFRGQPAIQMIAREYTAEARMRGQMRAAEINATTLIELMSDYSYEVSFQAGDEVKLAWLSSEFAEITGYSEDDLSDMQNMNSLIHPEDQSIARRHIQNLRQGDTSIIEYRLVAKSGESVWVRDHARPLRDDATGKIIGFAGLAQNISERAETDLALKNHALQQAVVAEVGLLALAGDSPPETILDDTLILTAQVLDVEYIRFFELDTSRSLFIPRSSTGWILETDDEPGTFTGEPKTQIAYTLLNDEPVVSSDLENEIRFGIHPDLKREAIRSGISVVVKGQHHPLGVLIGHSKRVRDYTADDVNFTQSITNILGAYLEGQRAQTAEREQREFAEALRDITLAINSTLELDEVLDRVLDNLSRVVPYDSASVMLVEGGEARMIRHIGYEKFGTDIPSLYKIRFAVREIGVYREMFGERKPIIVTDTTKREDWQTVVGVTGWIRGYMGAPIFFQNTVMGIINVDSATPDVFNDSQSQRLMAFADQVAIAIRNAQRTTELEQVITARTVELEQQRRRLQSILDASGEGIAYTTDGKIIYANNAFYQIAGYEPGTLEGVRMETLVYDPEAPEVKESRAQARAALTRGEIWRGEMQLGRADGSIFDAGLTRSRVSTDDSADNTVTVIRDISAAKLLDAQKSRFIANASHELRSPITSLNTRLFIMRRKPEDMERHIDLLEKVINRMNHLVEDMLDFSRFEHGAINLQRRNVVAQTLVTDVLDVQRDEARLNKQIEITADLAPDPLHVLVDPDRIVQVITNLIANAINYTTEGGNVIVRVYEDEGQDMAVISVSDTGVGIKPDDLPHIFQPFYRVTEEKKGTGLGLSISREIVQLHDGDLRAESVVGEGSTFSIRLPLLPNSAPEG